MFHLVSLLESAERKVTAKPQPVPARNHLDFVRVDAENE